ncbi:MAG TPA: cytochrome c-type biogenesis protein CcmH [Candidatus Binataceae bacterium]|jgi:cytochrome c-type biogenesis protein CcmH|nr:cytochrome c-type biogenesis protein CcmH [Candidatus Binataceae bacterium]
MMRIRLALMLVMFAVVLSALAPGASGAPARTTVQEVGEGLTCQCGCGLTVANCNHPSCGFAIPTRGEIAAMIQKGMSRAQILAEFRHKYGEKVLSAPTTEGFNLLAWVIPYVAVGAGMVLVLIAVARWRRREDEGAGAAKAPAAVSGDQFDAGLRQRLERDLRRQL